MSGRVVLDFVIGYSGTVSSARASTLLSDKRLSECIARSAYALNFPAPEGGIIHVRYPLLLDW